MHREMGRCRDGTNCPRKHVTHTGTCKNDGYIQKGFCSKWYTCEAQHPWDSAKHGDKREALQKYKEERKKARESAAAKESAGGSFAAMDQ
jgi:hypothetical protein